jgi:hypothetical protein
MRIVFRVKSHRRWLKPHLRFPFVPAWLDLSLSHLTPEAQRKHYMMLRKRVSCFRLYGYILRIAFGIMFR